MLLLLQSLSVKTWEAQKLSGQTPAFLAAPSQIALLSEFSLHQLERREIPEGARFPQIWERGEGRSSLFAFYRGRESCFSHFFCSVGPKVSAPKSIIYIRTHNEKANRTWLGEQRERKSYIRRTGDKEILL